MVWIRGGTIIVGDDFAPELCRSYPCGPCCDLVTADSNSRVLWDTTYYDGDTTHLRNYCLPVCCDTKYADPCDPPEGCNIPDLYPCLDGSGHVFWDFGAVGDSEGLIFHPTYQDDPGGFSLIGDGDWSILLKSADVQFIHAECTFTVPAGMENTGEDDRFTRHGLGVPIIGSTLQVGTEPLRTYAFGFPIQFDMHVASTGRVAVWFALDADDVGQPGPQCGDGTSEARGSSVPFPAGGESIGNAPALYTGLEILHTFVDDPAVVKLSLCVSPTFFATIRVNDSKGISFSLLPFMTTAGNYDDAPPYDSLGLPFWHDPAPDVPEFFHDSRIDGVTLMVGTSSDVFTRETVDDPNGVAVGTPDYEVHLSSVGFGASQGPDHVECEPCQPACIACSDGNFPGDASISLDFWKANGGSFGACVSPGYPTGEFALSREFDIRRFGIHNGVDVGGMCPQRSVNHVGMDGPGRCQSAGHEFQYDAFPSQVLQSGILPLCRWGCVFDEEEYINVDGLVFDSITMSIVAEADIRWWGTSSGQDFDISGPTTNGDGFLYGTAFISEVSQVWDGSAIIDIGGEWPTFDHGPDDNGLYWWSMPRPIFLTFTLWTREDSPFENPRVNPGGVAAFGHALIGYGKYWFTRTDAGDIKQTYTSTAVSDTVDPYEAFSAGNRYVEKWDFGSIDCGGLSGISMMTSAPGDWITSPGLRCGPAFPEPLYDYVDPDDFQCIYDYTWNAFADASIGT